MIISSVHNVRGQTTFKYLWKVYRCTLDIQVLTLAIGIGKHLVNQITFNAHFDRDEVGAYIIFLIYGLTLEILHSITINELNARPQTI